MSGRFFVFDGMDGAGKSTAVGHLEAMMIARGYRVLRTREPGGSPLAEEIRECLLRERNEPMPPEAELLLVFAARAAHLQQTVWPAVARGEVVLCDRFVDSSYVYQGALGGIAPEWIDELSQRTVMRSPDQTFIFDLPVELAAQRMQQRGLENRFDQVDAARLECIRTAFLKRVQSNPNSHTLIDASQAETAVAERLLAAVAGYLP